MRVLLFNLRTDVDHTALGFTTAWINALAPHCERIEVITMHRGRLDVAANVEVRSVGREQGLGRIRRLLRFYRLALSAAIRRRPDVCFAHMTPLFASLFSPIARMRRIPILLWYAHGNVTRELRIAHALADRCATSTANGFRLPSGKLSVLGQGVDVERFRLPSRRAAGYERTVLSIGRMTPSKQMEEALEAVAAARASIDLRLRVVGGPVSEDDVAYDARIRARARELGLEGAVEFVGAVPYAQIASEYAAGATFLNLSSTGSLDKAILEAMASGCIPVSRNTSFAALAAQHGFGELVAGPGAEGAADALVRVMSKAAGERDELSERLRAVVVAEHSLERLAAAVAGELQALARRN